LVLSGILEGQSVAVEDAIRGAGLQVGEKRLRRDWVALVAEKPAAE
jgi:ribosomal protein L11 methylase PrmA